MSYAYNELFWGKASVYCLVANGQRWEDRGTGGQLRLYRNKDMPNDVQIGWFKDAQQLWWRLAPGKHSKLRGKGPRAWVVKANSTITGEQETLAIRFSNEKDSGNFEIEYNKIFGQQQVQPAQPRAQPRPPPSAQQSMVNVRQSQEDYARQLRSFNTVPNVHQMPQQLPNQRTYPAYSNANAANASVNIGVGSPPNLPNSMASQPNLFQNNQAYQFPNNGLANGYNNGFNYNQNNQNFANNFQNNNNNNNMNQNHNMSSYNNINNNNHNNQGYPVNMSNNNNFQMPSRPQPPPVINNINNVPPSAVPSATTWSCGVCTYENIGERLKCGLCGMPRRRASGDSSIKAPAIPQTPRNQQQQGGFANGGGYQSPQQQHPQSFQFQHQARSSGIGLDRQPSLVNGQWRCPVCTLVNEDHAKSCEACNKPRPNKRAADYGPSKLNLFFTMGQPRVKLYVDEDDEDPQEVNINGSGAHDDYKFGNDSGIGGPTVAPRDKFGNIISGPQDFENACSDIVACNLNPKPVFNTLKSVSRKLTKDDVRYRTLDLQNPRVVERLIGYEGVIDFLTLLGFASDENGIKLVCERKPSNQVVRNAVTVLQMYEDKLEFKQPKPKPADSRTDLMSDATPNGANGSVAQGSDIGANDVGLDIKSVEQEDDNEMSIDQIIAWGTHEHARDTESINTLIMTHTLYSDSLSLLRALRKRYFVAIPADIRDSGDQAKISEFQEKVQKKIQLKVLKAVKDWMKTYWETDFGDNEQLRKEVLSFVEQMEKKQNECPWNGKFAGMIKQDFQKYCERGGLRRPSVKKLANVTIPKNFDLTNMKKIKAEEFADQVTLMDFGLFCKIESRECLGQAWKKKDSVKKAPNVLALIKQFNNITTLIQMHILNETGLSKRAKRLGYIIKMGERFRTTHNYNALCAVFSALNSAPIHRLKTLWKRLSEKENKAFQAWRSIFDSGGNHRNLRASLRSATGACIPHIGIFLQDLVFIEDGNDTRKPTLLDEKKGSQKMVNFAKQMKLADRIQYIHRYQNISYDYKENDVFQRALLDEFEKYKDYTEDEIWEISTAVKKADK